MVAKRISSSRPLTFPASLFHYFVNSSPTNCSLIVNFPRRSSIDFELFLLSRHKRVVLWEKVSPPDTKKKKLATKIHDYRYGTILFYVVITIA